LSERKSERQGERLSERESERQTQRERDCQKERERRDSSVGGISISRQMPKRCPLLTRPPIHRPIQKLEKKIQTHFKEPRKSFTSSVLI